jgi:HTH-type transcriptional regulator/antitoxin MqsA
MRYEKHDDVLEYRDHKRTIKTLGWWCTKCDEAILTGDPLVRHERAFLQLKAEVDGVLGPREVTKVRESLGLSQRKAGEVLGGGPRAFQKYESGKQAVSTPMSHLLRLLERDPSRLEELVTVPSLAQGPAKGREGPSRRRKVGRSQRSARA